MCFLRDLIFVSMEDWDHVWRRNQFVCAELARRHPDCKILFVGLPIDVSNRARRGKLGELFGRHTRPVEGYPNIVLTHPVKLLPNTMKVGRRVNEAMFRRHVRRAAERVGLRDPVLWLNPHWAGHMAGRMGERAVVYDITDDWTSMKQRPWLTGLIKAQDAELCRRADAVIVCSERLREMKQGLTDRLHLIPNGVDADHYGVVLDGTGPLPEATHRWPRPVFGYTGSLHADRVDIELVREVATRVEGSLVFVGPDMLTAEQRRRITEPGNVILHGAVPYHDLPQYMRAFEACFVPHHVTPFTESLNPIKLWEYLAAGKPIVSTPVAGFREFGHLVSLASCASSMADALKEAMTEPPARGDARRLEAARHSWSSRVDSIEATLSTIASPRPAMANEVRERSPKPVTTAGGSKSMLHEQAVQQDGA
jgi:teichuronic acid biosynthesis glycosyltransferase TuaH